MKSTHRIEQDLAGIEVKDRLESRIDLGEGIDGKVEWGDGDKLPGESADATDEVDMCVYEMGGLGRPGPGGPGGRVEGEEGAI